MYVIVYYHPIYEDMTLEGHKLYDSLEEAKEAVDAKVAYIPSLKEYLKIYELKEVQ